MKDLRFPVLVVMTVMTLVLALPTGCGSPSEQEVPPIVFISPTDNSSNVNTAANVELAAGEPDADAVKLLGVSLSADRIYIMVSFTAPPQAVQGWGQGSIYVVDESSGALYRDIPIVPVLGTLFGRPQQEGQMGYVMLNNPADGIRSGSVVSVVLGRFKREHVMVQ
jgi:hypothetical protein